MKKQQQYWNPVGVVFIVFCTAVAALLGNAWAGLVVGSGFSLLMSLIRA